MSKYQFLYPLAYGVYDWDKESGDAQELKNPDQVKWGFLHSSHCLEHLVDPWAALRTWCQCVYRGGHLVITVPDEDLYERGVWPSRFNADHKHTFTMYKESSWSPVSINVLDLIAYVADLAECVSVLRLEGTFDPRNKADQTLEIGECAIEFVLRRK